MRSNCRRVGLDLSVVQKIALGRLARRVTDHARSTAHDHEGRSTVLLQMGQHEYLQQVAHRQRAGRGVEADVGTYRAFRQARLEALRRLGY